MVDEKETNANEKEDKELVSLQIRYGKVKDELSEVKKERDEIKNQLSQLSQNVSNLTAAQNKQESELKGRETQFKQLQEKMELKEAAWKAGVRDTDYFVFRYQQEKQQAEANKQELKMESFVDKMKTESKAKGLNLFNEQATEIPATTSAVHQNPNGPKSTAASVDLSKDAIEELKKTALKKNSLGQMVNIARLEGKWDFKP